MKLFYVVLALSLVVYSCTSKEGKTTANVHSTFPDGQWIDLTYAYDENTVYWPTAEGFHLDTAFEGMTDKGYYYSAYQFCSAEHGGTHMDAPIHFAEGKQAVDEVPVNQVIGAAVVIDVSEKALANPDYKVSVADFEAWEKMHGNLPQGVIVLLRTGYGQFWPDRVKYMGTDERGEAAVAKLHFPGLDPAAAQWLVENRQIKAIGLDTPSIDYGQSTHFESHQILFKANIPALENVANLNQLPVTGSHVIALPMKIKGGSGGPVRIVALLPS
ncbi:MAG: cyclase family protein [Saprospiraceae bacterium]